MLHIDELTYSVTAPQGEPRVAGDVVTSYRRLGTALVTGLRLLGCDVGQAGHQAGSGTAGGSAACFEVPSHYEVTVAGRKLIGSAQVRRRGVVLQHGALPLSGDPARLAEVLAVPRAQREQLAKRLRQRAIALDEAVGRSVGFEEVTQALVRGFTEALSVGLEPGELLEAERADVERLRQVYSGDEWTLSR